MSRTATLPRSAALALAIAGIFAIAGCAPPEPPDPERKPEPIAPAAQSDAPHTELREAIQQPIDDAKAASDLTEDAARRQRDEIDAQTGG